MRNVTIDQRKSTLLLKLCKRDVQRRADRRCQWAHKQQPVLLREFGSDKRADQAVDAFSFVQGTCTADVSTIGGQPQSPPRVRSINLRGLLHRVWHESAALCKATPSAMDELVRKRVQVMHHGPRRMRQCRQ